MYLRFQLFGTGHFKHVFADLAIQDKRKREKRKKKKGKVYFSVNKL